MEFNEWGEDVIEGEIIIDIRYSDLVGDRYEKLREEFLERIE